MPGVAEVVAPPDSEAMYVSHLAASFAERSETARVATSVPKIRPDRMVRVSLIDTVRQTPVHFHSQLLVECWAPAETAAGDLARLAFALTNAMEGETYSGVFICEVDTGGVANFPDPDVGPRYQFTADLLVRGGVI